MEGEEKEDRLLADGGREGKGVGSDLQGNKELKGE